MAANPLVRLRNKRAVLTGWAVLILVQFAIASQNWYHVRYTFDGTVKSLDATGIAAWQLINGSIMFDAVGLAAVLLSRGMVRKVIAAVVTLVSLGIALLNLGALGSSIPPAVNAMVVKASGVAGGVNGSASDAIVSISSRPGFHIGFAITVIWMLVVQVATFVSATSWNQTQAVDKYARQPATNAKSGAKSGSKSKKSKKKLDSKSNNISLWDSQR